MFLDLDIEYKPVLKSIEEMTIVLHTIKQCSDSPFRVTLKCGTIIGSRIDYCGFGPFSSTPIHLMIFISLLKVLISKILYLRS